MTHPAEPWTKEPDPPEDWETWTPIEIVRLNGGWQVEVNGVPRGIMFPELSGAHFFITLLLGTPQFADGRARVAYADRRNEGDA